MTSGPAGDTIRERALRLVMPWLAWYAGKDFTKDWVGGTPRQWMDALAPVRASVQAVLEIGSFEGRSAIIWLEYLPNATLTCIDTFDRDGAEGRFDRNLAPYGPRLRKIKSRSAAALGQLLRDGESYDVIYVDGSHLRDNVMIDCLVSWQLLRDGGVLILDDYLLDPGRDPAERPQEAIDVFIAWHEGHFDLLFKNRQVGLRKRSASPPAAAASTTATT